jgi:inosose dehydratase
MRTASKVNGARVAGWSPGRRDFTLGAGALGLSLLAGLRARPALAGKAAPAAATTAGVLVGYAAITWGDKKGKTAIEDIAAAGYPGIQLRKNILEDFKTPADLKAELDRQHLVFACVSGGSPLPDPAKRQEEIEKFMKLAKFAREAGALSIQATSPKRADKVEPAELKAFGETLTEIGRRTADIGLPLVFHPHMNQIGQDPEDVAAIMAASDPAYVKLLLDTGHWAAAGGDPVKAVKQYARRLAVLHIKDVRDRKPGPDPKDTKKYEFVELGQGKVDFKAVFRALKAAKFSGWAIVELDTVPEGRDPKEAALANKEFLVKKVGLKV